MNIDTPAAEITKQSSAQSSTSPDPEALYAQALELDGLGKSKKWIIRSRDRQKAAELYREAAILGHASAMYNYALCCLRGEGVPKNKENQVQAVVWFRKAAEADIADAYNNLGYCHELGLGGLVRDVNEAERNYGIAASMKNSTGNDNLTDLREYRAESSKRLLRFRRASGQAVP